MASTNKSAWKTSGALVTNPKTAGLVTPYNLPKTVNVLLRSNQKVLLGAIAIDSLRSKNAPSSFSGSLIVYKPSEIEGNVFIGKQPIQFKANLTPLSQPTVELATPIVIEPKCDYKLRFVFDSSWVPRNFYCLSKIIEYDIKIDANTTVTLSPEKVNGDVCDNELPLILFFNRM